MKLTMIAALAFAAGLAACGSPAAAPTVRQTVAPTVAPSTAATATPTAAPSPTPTLTPAVSVSFTCEATQYQGKRVVWAYVVFHNVTVGDSLSFGSSPQQDPITANPFREGVPPNVYGITFTPGLSWTWYEKTTPAYVLVTKGTFTIPKGC